MDLFGFHESPKVAPFTVNPAILWGIVLIVRDHHPERFVLTDSGFQI